MGLLKYNNQSFAVAELPDGLVAIQESEINSLKGQINQYLSLKSRIPVGVDESQLGALIERGQRYDGVLSEKAASVAKIQELESKVQQFSNIPADFQVEKWNGFVQKERDGIFSQKVAALTEKVYEKVKAETGVQPKVDPRFIDREAMKSFDPDSATALDTLYKVLDSAHTAQQEFLQSSLNNGVPTSDPIGAPSPPNSAGNLNLNLPGPKGDGVTATGISVSGLR